MNILVPMAGPEPGFDEAGFAFCKSLCEVARRPVVEHVIENLSAVADARFVFVVKKSDVQRFHIDSVLRLLAPSCEVILAEESTGGAACTALLAIEAIEPDESLIIANGDQVIRADLGAVVREFEQRELDGGIAVFENVHPRWSYVRLDEDGLVVEAAEKRPISRYATAGFYYFRRARDFVEGAMAMIRKQAATNDQYYVCPVYNELILKQRRIGVHEIAVSAYFSMSSPAGLRYYEDHLTSAAEGRES